MTTIKSVLIVDDDRDDIDLFCEVVNEIDDSIQCFTASDGNHALRLLHDQKIPLPGLIFLDLNMPKSNGKQCLTEIRKNKDWDAIPIFIYTTSRTEEEQRETKKLGASGFITKPSSYKEILRILSEVLNGKEVSS